MRPVVGYNPPRRGPEEGRPIVPGNNRFGTKNGKPKKRRGVGPSPSNPHPKFRKAVQKARKDISANGYNPGEHTDSRLEKRSYAKANKNFLASQVKLKNPKAMARRAMARRGTVSTLPRTKPTQGPTTSAMQRKRKLIRGA